MTTLGDYDYCIFQEHTNLNSAQSTVAFFSAVNHLWVVHFVCSFFQGKGFVIVVVIMIDSAKKENTSWDTLFMSLNYYALQETGFRSYLMEQPFLYTLQVSDGNILDNSGTAKGQLENDYVEFSNIKSSSQSICLR